MHNIFSLFDNYLYDFKKYLSYSSAIYPPQKLAQLEAKITARYHNIEKGLSLANIKLGFGKEKIEILFSFLDQYVNSGFDQERQTFQIALSVLDSYVKYHEKNDFEVNWIKGKLKQYSNLSKNEGGTVTCSKNEIIEKEKLNFESLALNRHSIRNFSKEAVSEKDILKAIKIAQKSPSVCNRQSGRVHVVRNEKLKSKVLELHKGNAGFGDSANLLLIVSSDLRTFTSVGERNQGYIDGSLFGMTLTYALHSLGLATCIMNWSVEKDDDKKLHLMVGIPDQEVVVFLIAVGQYPDKFEVAKSTRKDIKEVVKLID